MQGIDPGRFGLRTQTLSEVEELKQALFVQVSSKNKTRPTAASRRAGLFCPAGGYGLRIQTLGKVEELKRALFV